jgi:very-short-patch-repair endonuclease
MILPGTGRGTIRRRANGGGGGSLRKPEVYAARKLRRQMSLPEAILWRELRGEKLGFKVRRQHPLGPYVVDFYVREGALVIEVDGEAHNRGDRPARDHLRDEFLTRNGHRIVRFSAVDVMTNLEGVVRAIAVKVGNPLHHPSDGPPPHAGEDIIG